MDRVYEKAYGKINLSLDVLGRRKDGYHDVSMVMQTVYIYDVITLSKLEGKDEIVLTTDVEGLPTGEGNIVYKAIKLIKEEYGIDTGVSAHIEKHLPIAAGMGGGSADAAAALRGMNRLFELGLKSERLEELGVRLGADVPFLIKGGIALAEGIGEKLTALPAFPECSLVIVKPNVSVSTKEVYEAIDRKLEGAELAQREADVNRFYNELELYTLTHYREVRNLVSRIREHLHADEVLMSGSGPTVAAYYTEETRFEADCEALESARWVEPTWRYWKTKSGGLNLWS